MISNEAIGTSLATVLNLESKNIGVCPVENTLLDKLLRSSNMDVMPFDGGDFTDKEINAISIYSGEKDQTTGYSEHSVIMDEAVEKISTAVTNHLQFARSTVVPFVNNLREKIILHSASVMYSNLLDFEIKIVDLPSPLKDPSIIDSLQRAQDISRQPYPGNNIKMVVPTVDEIIEQMKTGMPSADKDIELYANSLGNEKLIKIYSILFCGNSDLVEVSASVTPSNPDLFNTEDGLDIALVGFLISRRIWNNPPENVQMSLSKYEESMVELRNQAAAYLNVFMSSWEGDIKNGVLIKSFNKLTVNVNGPVYKKWIEDGGKNEIIFGSLVSGSSDITVDDLAIDAEKSLSNWEVYCASKTTVEANRRFTAMNDIAMIEFQAAIVESSEEDIPSNERDGVMLRFKQELAKTCMNDITPENIGNWVLRLVCNSLFYKTDAYRIITVMDEVMKRNPSIDVREAAHISATDYVVYWLASMIKLFPFSSSK